jgi:hypothetical protein
MNYNDLKQQFLGKLVDDGFGNYKGECFTKGHLISMADWTYKYIEDILVWDKVLNADGKGVNTVVDCLERTAPTRLIECGSTRFTTTAEHPFLTTRGFVKAKDLLCVYTKKHKREGDLLVFPLHETQESWLTDDELRLYGLWIADGSLAKTTIRLTLNKWKKLTYLEWLNIPFSMCKHSTCDNAVNISLSHPSRVLKNIIFRSYDEYRMKQLWYAFSPREAKYIIEGYLEGDGYAISDGTYEITSISKKLMFWFQRLARSIGYTMTIQNPRNWGVRIVCWKECDTAPIYKGSLNKSPKSERGFAPEWVRIFKSWNTTGTYTVYNLTTDGDHTYVCNNIWVHNCVSLIKQYLIQMWYFKGQRTSGNAKGLVYTLPALAIGYECKPLNSNTILLAKPWDILVKDNIWTYGHTGLFDSYIDATKTIVSLEQNAWIAGTSLGAGDEVRLKSREVFRWTHIITKSKDNSEYDRASSVINKIDSILLLTDDLKEYTTSDLLKEIETNLNKMKNNAIDYRKSLTSNL